MLRHARNCFLGIGLLCLAVLGAASVLGAMRRRPEPHPLCIFATGALNGVLVPCGCAPDQLGGLARRASFLQRYEGCRERLIVDAGNLTAGFGPSEPFKVQPIASALARMGYFAVNLGEQDFFLGLEPLKRLRAAAPQVHVLSANVSHESNEAFAEPLAVWQARGGSPRIAVVGLLSHVYSPQLTALKSGFSIQEPSAALRQAIDSLKQKPDIVVVIYRGPHPEARGILKDFPEVTIMVNACDDRDAATERAGDSQVLLVTGQDGQHVAVAGVQANQDGDWTADSREVAPLSKAVGESPEIRTILQEYQNELRERRVLDLVPRRPLPDGLRYVGSNTCRACHSGEHALWSRLSHAHAYETLLENGHAYDPDCVSCHVTGFGFESGYTDAERTPNLVGVGCESCHHPGSRHVDEQVAGLPLTEYGKTTPADCLACHTPARSPAFDYDTYLGKIDHWSDEAKASLKAQPLNRAAPLESGPASNR